MNNLFGFMIIAILGKIKCQQVLSEELVISTQEPGENLDLKNAKIERRFLEDLSDHEWHVAHLRTAVFDGRKACMSDTFADTVRRYRKMLKEDGARVEYVSADALHVDPKDLVEESCKTNDDSNFFNNVTMKITSGNFIDATTVAQNVTSAGNTTDSMKVVDTTPTLDFKATTAESKVKPKQKEMEDHPKNDTRRTSEYMFSSVEYYDESTEFDPNLCPDAVEIITLQIDQLRSYDLECEMIVEWRSLE